jgi:VIT1/CCC1 family predicted Fe2+/Mn2+ transporter
LRDIYIARGLDAELAAAVATQLMTHDALGAHGRDELGFPMHWQQNPCRPHCHRQPLLQSVQFYLCWWFSCFPHWLMWSVAISALLFLALLGSVAAYAGGASVTVAAARVTFWGALAMALTAGVGALFGVAA